MKVAIHQPEHLPWPNFFRKMASADLMVVLDSVQFRKNYFQNRNRIMRRDGLPGWLTVPVRHLASDTTIAATKVVDDGHWKSRYLNKFRDAYSASEGMHFLGNDISEVVSASGASLANLNLNLIRLLMEKLEIGTPLVNSSALTVSGSKTGLLLEICREVGATTYLAGSGSIDDYLDVKKFRSVGIDVESFPVGLPKYQGERGNLGLSVVDLMMSEGGSSRSYFRHLESDEYWGFNAAL